MSEERTSTAPDTDATGLPLAIGMLIYAPIALLGNEIGSLFRYPDIGAAVLFVPYAALTTALVVSARRHWVWYILVGSVAHFVAHWPRWSLSWVLIADVANVARALTAALMLRWLFQGRPRLDGIPSLASFVLSAVLVAPAVGATLGATNVVLHGVSPPYWPVWRAWYMSNALTGLTILPAFVLAIEDRARLSRHRPSRRRVAESLALALALALASTVAFLPLTSGRWHLALVLYAPLPVLIWAAMRFGAAGATVALTGVTFAAIWSAGHGAGPFLASSPDENVLVLQLFVLLTAVPVLCIAAVSGARRKVVQLHNALLASLHDRVAILDARGVVLEVNESWRRFAQTPDAVSFRHVGVGDDYLRACGIAAERGDATSARVLAGVTSVLRRERTRFEMEYDDDRNGHRKRYELSVEALERSDGGAVVTRADITARRQAQIEIEEQRRELSHLARVAVLGELSGALAHELNQPLASISSNAEAGRLLLKARPVDLEEVDTIFRDIVVEDQRAAQVIRRLRALLKRGESRLQPTDTAELVNDVLDLAHAELITRRVTATAVVAPNLPLVLADRVQVQQVLLNLILNACEAMSAIPARERRVSLIVNNDARNNVQFSIRDCGTGIAPELIHRLFEPFVTTKPEGLGLGLSISRTIVAAHGGRLWAENNLNGGATVHCLLATAADGTVADLPHRGSADGAPVLTTAPASPQNGCGASVAEALGSTHAPLMAER